MTGIYSSLPTEVANVMERENAYFPNPVDDRHMGIGMTKANYGTNNRMKSPNIRLYRREHPVSDGLLR